MTKKRVKVLGWKWKGEREFIPGVPPRDMDAVEVDQRGIRNIVENSGLFEPITETEDNSDGRT